MRNVFISVLVGGLGVFHCLHSATFSITSTADSGPGTLRDALLTIFTNANASDDIDFTPVAGMTIILNPNSPLCVASSTNVLAKTINFTNAGANVVLNGNGNQAFWIGPILSGGTVVSSVSGISFQNCSSVGGAGGSSTNLSCAGGGGMGAGGSIFVSNNTNVTVSNCSFMNSSAIGGAGGSSSGVAAFIRSGTGGGGYGQGANGGSIGGGGGGFRTPGGSGDVALGSGGGGGGAFFVGGPTVFGAGGAGNGGGGGGGGSAASAAANGGAGTSGGAGSGGAGGIGITGTSGGVGGANATQSAGGSGTNFAGGGGGGQAEFTGLCAGNGGSSSVSGCGGGGAGAGANTCGSGGALGGAGGPFGGGGCAGRITNNSIGGVGGAGGFMGGGGGGASMNVNAGGGGSGGFGGGGAGAGRPSGNVFGISVGGNGGFGGGGGGGRQAPGLGGTDAGSGGTGFFGGIDGGPPGGGGAGLGGAIFVATSGTLTFGAGNTFSGSSVAGGAAGTGVNVSSPAAAGTGQGSDLYLVSGSVIVSNPMTLTGSLAVPPGTQFTKTGAGQLNLSAASRITAQVNINGGTLAVSADNQLGTGTTVAIGAVGTLRGIGSFTGTKNLALVAGSTVAVDPTFNMIFPTTSGAGGTLTKTGSGVFTLTGAGAHTGGTTISAGTLALSGSGSLSSTGIVVNNSLFDISQVTTSSTIGPLSGSGTTSLGSKNLNVNSTAPSTYSGVMSDGGIAGGAGGTFTKTGASTLTMTGVSTFTGGVTNSAGTLAFSGAGSFSPDGVFTNTATLDISQVTTSATIPSLQGSGPVFLGSKTLITGSSSNTTYSGNMQDGGIGGGVAGNLTKVGTGTLTLTTANTFTGNLNISQGTLALTGLGAVPQANVTVDGTFNVSGITPASTAITTLNGTLPGAAIVLGAKNLSIANGSYGGGISGTGSVSKTSAGTLALSGVSTYSGGTILSAGTLNINSDSSLGAAGTNLNVTGSSTLQLSGNAPGMARAMPISAGQTLTVDTNTFNMGNSGVISGATGSLTKTGSGTLALTGVNTYGGGTTLNGGTLNINSDNALGLGGTNVNVTGSSTLQIAANIPSMARPMPISAAQTLTIDTNSFNMTNSGLISGATGSLTKTGAGTLALNGVNTYGGGTTLNGGTLNINSDSSLGVAGTNINVTGSSTLQIAANIPSMTRPMPISAAQTLTIDTNSFNMTNSGLISGATGSLAKTGAGTLTLSGMNTYGGGTTLNGGTLNISSDSALGVAGTNVNLTGSSTLQLGASIAGMARPMPISPAQTLTVDTNAFNLTNSGVISGATGSLTKIGGGTLALTGVNTYGGGTTLNAGTLNINSDSALGSLGTNLNVTGSSTLQLSGNALGMTRAVPISAGQTLTVDTNAFNMGNSGVISGATGSLTKIGTGTLALTGASTYGGGTTLNAGILNINSDSALGAAGTNLNVTGSSTLELSGNALGMARPMPISAGQTLTVNTNLFSMSNSGLISGATGSVEKTGAGTLILTGMNTYGGGTTLNGGTLNINSDSALGVAGTNVNVTGSSTLQIAANIPSMARPMPISAAQTLNIDTNTFNLTSSGVISGATGSLTKSNSGRLTLTGVNTYGGGTTLNGGTLNINSDSALGVAGTNVNVTASSTLQIAANIPSMARPMPISPNQTLTFDTNTFDMANSGLISGASGAVNKVGLGTLTLTGVNTYGGGTTLNQGTLNINQDASLGVSGTNLNVTGSSTLQLSGNVLGMSRPVPISSGQTLTVDSNSFNLTNSGSISGSGASLNKIGSGLFTLTGSNTYDGGTTISGGSLVLSGSGILSPAGAVAVNGIGATFDIIPSSGNQIVGDLSSVVGSFINLGANTLSFGTATPSTIIAGVVTGGPTGSLSKNGSGAVSLLGMNTYGGGTTLAGGSLIINSDSSLGVGGTNLNVTSNAALQLAANVAGMNRAVPISSGQVFTVDTNGFNLSNAGIISGSGASLVKIGAGTLTLTGANSYSGGTTVSAGTLQGNTLSLQGVILNNSIVDFDQPVNGTYSSVMSGSGTLVKSNSGTLVLTGANTYSGGTTINAGCVEGNTISVQGNILNNSCLIFDQNFAGTYSGILSGTGTTAKQGTDTLSINANSPAYTGTTTVVSGTLHFNGALLGGDVIVNPSAFLTGIGTMSDLTVSGTVSPGNSIGTLNVANLVLNPGSVFDNEIDGMLNSDLILASGTAAVDGTLNVLFLPGIYFAGNTYTVITAAGGVSGSFASVVEASTDFDILTTYLPNSVLITLIPPQQALVIPPAGGFGNPNVRSVVNNLNILGKSATSLPLLQALLSPLVNQSMSVEEDAFNRLQPSQYSALTEQSVEITNFLTSMFHASSLSFCCPNRSQKIICRYQDSNLWVQPYLYRYRLSEYDWQPMYHSNNAGFAVGFDTPILEGWLLGVAGAYNYDSLKWSDQRGKAILDSGFLSLYTEWTNDQFFWGLTALGGIDFIDVDRFVKYTGVDLVPKSFHRAYDFVSQFEAGATFELNEVILCPYFKLNYLYFHQEGFTENGGSYANLKVRSNSNQTFVSEAGIQIQKIFHFENGCMAPLIGFNWIAEVPIQRDNYVSNFVGESVSFTTYGYDSYRYTFSFPIQLSGTHNQWSVIGGYTPKFGKYIWGQDASLQINYAF